MVQSKAPTVEAYLAELEPERRGLVAALIKAIEARIDPGYELTMAWGMPTWVVPLDRYPTGYLGNPAQGVPYLSVASQKQYLAYYHPGFDADPALAEWFRGAWAQTGLPLSLGRSCLRLRPTAPIPYALLGELAGRVGLEEHLDRYEQARAGR
ncbi:hypothetical protein GCM10011512_17590 [Tersicoccus solisilvae]|uniref:YdhG-like domain-containing protein n=1 Tax=Tersicoccus solisilvae TaxID=1882339 RepID=A0ABQ1P6G2_9MICC|nr:DUF1801 domain-containing protein [Tersicoccus solisilvae]GGC91018.1 hypothetical protein GCM10011512_17590 [Tersicoccus solisilvae]